MSLRICKNSTLEQLRDDIRINLNHYRGGDFAFLLNDAACYIELDVDFDEKAILNLSENVSSSSDDYLSEKEAAIGVYSALSKVSPYLAREERMWAYLTHTCGLNYARHRWPIPEDDEKAEKHIRTHFFANSARQIERDNAISRLWWMAYLCSRVQSISLSKALQAFLYKSDVRANIVERPTTSQSLRTFDCVISRLSASLNGDKELFNRDRFRQSMSEMNLLGGTRLFEALPNSHLDAIFDSVFTEVGE